MANVLITGGARGIGRGISEAFVKNGDNIVYTCQNEESLEKSFEILKRLGGAGSVHGILCDSKDYCQVKKTVDEAAKLLQGIDILVNNAAVRKYGTLYEISVNEWEEAIATNVNGYFYFCKCSINYLLESTNAWVINIGSTAGNNSFSGGISYNTTKSAIHGFSGSLQLDMRMSGIRVCNVIPGNVFNKDSVCPKDDEWMMKPIDIGNSIVSQLSINSRCMPTILELKPTYAPVHPEKGIRALRYV